MWANSFPGFGGGFCGWGPSFGSGPWFMGWLFPLLFWGIIVYVIICGARYLISLGKENKSEANALEVLKTRYASGEISQEDFNNMKKVIVSK